MSTRSETRKITSRASHLKDHIARAQRAREKLLGLRDKAREMADLADDAEVSTSTRAWHHEGFTLKLWFKGDVPGQVITTANEHFDNFGLYGDSGHTECRSDYDYYVRAVVTVRYD